MIFVECKPDEKLIRVLLPNISRKYVIHSKNKSDIIKKLTKPNNSLSIGIVDEDPGASLPKLFSNYQRIKEFNDVPIALYRNKKNKTSLIILRPRLEGFIIRACRRNNLKLTNFNFSADEDEFHNKINNALDYFEKLLNHLISANNTDIITLKMVILDEERYWQALKSS